MAMSAVGKGIVQAVVAPEHLVADKERWRPENPHGSRSLGLLPQLELVGLRLRFHDDLLSSKIELTQHVAHDVRGVDFEIRDEIQQHDASAVFPYPSLFGT